MITQKDLLTIRLDLTENDRDDIYKHIRKIGREIGFEIASENVWELGENPTDKQIRIFSEECVEHERNHYRQFSPFHLLAHDMNILEEEFLESEGLFWGGYDAGVREGIKLAINRYLNP